MYWCKSHTAIDRLITHRYRPPQMPRFSARSLSPLDYGPPSVQNQPEDATTSFSHSALNNQVRQDVPSPSHNNDGRRRYHQDLNDPPLTDSATPRGRQRHSSRGTDDLFETLDRQSKDRQIVFRIHIPSSPSGLIWTGSTDYSGFFAYNRNTAIPPSAYMRVYYLADPSSTDRYGGGGDTGVNSPYESLERNWDMGPYMRHTMVDHIMGKMKQSLVNIPSTLEERPGTPEDDKSCWISTTRSLFWAIWDVARRLALAMEERQRLGDRGAEDRVELAVITQESKIHGGGDDRGKDKQSHPGATEREGNPVDPQAREVWVNPLPAIRHGIAQGRGGRLSVAMKETYEIALRTAEECQEVLYQGRIFAESIKMNLVFSSTVRCFLLPSGTV